ncbi:MAG: hypothetical protein ABIG85_01350, partial [Chloroflexota bacterium]
LFRGPRHLDRPAVERARRMRVLVDVAVGGRVTVLVAVLVRVDVRVAGRRRHQVGSGVTAEGG